MAPESLRRIAATYRHERELATMTAQARLLARQSMTRALWMDLQAWLTLKRRQIPNGSATAKAIDYSLWHWTALTRNLLDGDVPVDNNHIENLVRPLGKWGATRGCLPVVNSRAKGPRS